MRATAKSLSKYLNIRQHIFSIIIIDLQQKYVLAFSILVKQIYILYDIKYRSWYTSLKITL